MARVTRRERMRNAATTLQKRYEPALNAKAAAAEHLPTPPVEQQQVSEPRLRSAKKTPLKMRKILKRTAKAASIERPKHPRRAAKSAMFAGYSPAAIQKAVEIRNPRKLAAAARQSDAAKATSSIANTAEEYGKGSEGDESNKEFGIRGILAEDSWGNYLYHFEPNPLTGEEHHCPISWHSKSGANSDARDDWNRKKWRIGVTPRDFPGYHRNQRKMFVLKGQKTPMAELWASKK
ncbi:hypothetical protein K432DRAFT_379864 [Lepidopterella palustris CBS 459.81]|uniref:Uncharacterized protein n=1 Tax=Lepidopterella palustris CBS 459.81 TaxID=1314670 RepID=A0A8E2EFG2_9PEZI|nr:hypothetical protein K432DRAFT_379864 [Lepidopterella palustris CBS 459.81]